MRPLRILHVMASHRWTGAAEPTARLAAGQLAAGHEALLALTAGASFDKRAQEVGARTTGAVPFERSYLPWKKARDIRKLRELIGEFRPDVVHAHLTHDHMLAAFVLRGRKPGDGPALVRTFHREERVRAGFVQRRFLMRQTDGAFVVSDAMRGQLREAFGYADEQVGLVGGGIDTSRFRPNGAGGAMRGKWNVPEDAFVFGIVSRIRVARGHEWLLDAAAEALPQIPRTRLVICGRGNWQEEMLERIARHPAREQIVYAGYITGEDLENSYNAFDCALLLRPGNDGTCRAALEAMGCGRPVIGGDIGALHDLLAESEAGWLVPDGDVGELARTLIEAASDIIETRRRGENGLKLVHENYSEQLAAPRSIELYERVLSRRLGESR